MDRRAVQALCMRALASGGRQVGPFQVEWDIAGRCLAPVRREVYARAQRGRTLMSWKGLAFDRLEDTMRLVAPAGSVLNDLAPITFGAEKYGPYCVYLTAKCRKCDVCLKERSRLWARRACAEIKATDRTWFGTITLSPQWHERFAAQARLDSEKRRREVFEAMPLNEQLLARHRVIGRELMLAIKRLRKLHKFRYLLVLEAHASGLPHYHMLVHEIAVPIRKAQLDDIWPFGFTKWRLVRDEKAAWYVAKYLGKCATARVRASLRYGGPAISSICHHSSTERVVNNDLQRPRGAAVLQSGGERDGRQDQPVCLPDASGEK